MRVRVRVRVRFLAVLTAVLIAGGGVGHAEHGEITIAGGYARTLTTYSMDGSGAALADARFAVAGNEGDGMLELGAELSQARWGTAAGTGGRIENGEMCSWTLRRTRSTFGAMAVVRFALHRWPVQPYLQVGVGFGHTSDTESYFGTCPGPPDYETTTIDNSSLLGTAIGLSVPIKGRFRAGTSFRANSWRAGTDPDSPRGRDWYAIFTLELGVAF